jgi:hypothetical protein
MDAPKRYKVIEGRADAEDWYKAGTEEFIGLKEAGFGTLVPRPPGAKAIPTRMLCVRKVTGDLKARCVALDIRRKDQEALYSPVANDTSLKIFLATVVEQDMECDVVDIVKAFCQTLIEGTTHVEQPEGYVVKGKEDWLYELDKTLYGLRKSPYLFNKDLNSFLESMGFESSDADPCLYRNKAQIQTIHITNPRGRHCSGIEEPN